MTALLAILLLALPPTDATVWRKPDGVRGFEGMREEMQHLVDTSGRGAPKIQHLCAVLEDRSAVPGQDSDSPVIAWLYWPAGGYMYAFEPTALPPISDMNMLGSATVNLRSGVVKSKRDIRHGYDRRVPKSFVTRIAEACRVHGLDLTMEKRRAE